MREDLNIEVEQLITNQPLSFALNTLNGDYTVANEIGIDDVGYRCYLNQVSNSSKVVFDKLPEYNHLEYLSRPHSIRSNYFRTDLSSECYIGTSQQLDNSETFRSNNGHCEASIIGSSKIHKGSTFHDNTLVTANAVRIENDSYCEAIFDFSKAKGKYHLLDTTSCALKLENESHEHTVYGTSFLNRCFTVDTNLASSINLANDNHSLYFDKRELSTSSITVIGCSEKTNSIIFDHSTGIKNHILYYKGICCVQEPVESVVKDFSFCKSTEILKSELNMDSTCQTEFPMAGVCLQQDKMVQISGYNSNHIAYGMVEPLVTPELSLYEGKYSLMNYGSNDIAYVESIHSDTKSVKVFDSDYLYPNSLKNELLGLLKKASFSKMPERFGFEYSVSENRPIINIFLIFNGSINGENLWFGDDVTIIN